MPTNAIPIATAGVLLGALVIGAAESAEVVVEQKSPAAVTVRMTGDIMPGDEKLFSTVAQGSKVIFLTVNSEGGDIETAMRIGRVVRQHEGWVSTEGCYSSCVYILAGGVLRTGPTILDLPVIGVHRIYFAELAPNLTNQQIKARYDAELNRVRTYLAEVNVAPEFLSFMQQFPPEEMHVLTEAEYGRYLTSVDPIDAERNVANRAAEMGITSLEYRTRQVRGETECRDLVASSDEETRKLRVDCAMAIQYGISIDLYRKRSLDVNEKCRQFSNQEQQNRCEVHYLCFGRAVP